ncbi:MAG: ATP-dependent Clp protease proteolytic subunit [Bacteroidota bacterium]
MLFDHKEFKKYATKHMGISSMHLDTYARKSTAGMPNITGMTRAVIEERPTNFREIDVFSRLMMDRIIFLGTPVDDNIANIIQAQLLFLESTEPKRDIQMFVNSPGGPVIAGLGMYDTMQYITPDVSTICTGLAASMGAVLLAAGAAGKRSCLKHSRVMIHQPSGGMQGQVSDMEISYKLIKQMQEELYNILAHHTGQSYERIEQDSDRDRWLVAAEAKEYGLVDEVLERSKKSEEAE